MKPATHKGKMEKGSYILKRDNGNTFGKKENIQAFIRKGLAVNR